MKNPFKKKFLLYLITDREISGLSHLSIVKQSLSAGIRIIQLREKNMTKRQLYTEAVAIRKVTRRYNAIFIMNDYVDVAFTVNADGVHLGQDDMPIKEARKVLGKNRIIGISTHSLKQSLEAQQQGADYIGFGPVFETATKRVGAPRGLRALREIKKHINLPIIAIGGITHENITDITGSGIDSAAVASGILSGDMRQNTKKFLDAVKWKKENKK
jgi:thiamine-phosphate pyrophosphorylase